MRRRDGLLAAILLAGQLLANDSAAIASTANDASEGTLLCNEESQQLTDVLRLYSAQKLEEAEARLVDIIDGCGQARGNLNDMLKLLGDIRFDRGR